MAREQDMQALRGALQLNAPMAQYTSWRVGGPVDMLYRPADVQDLATFLRTLSPETEVLWCGLGSNLLVRDAGVRGAVILTHQVLDVLRRDGDAGVRAGAGVACAKLARQCARWGLGPAAFFAGIPGTVGGALAMNAGAFGGETWAHVEAVTVIDRAGRLHQRDAPEYQVGYRDVRAPAENEWFVEAHLQFEAEPEAGRAQIRELLSKRKQTQPIGLPSCGSVFTNPPGDHAARLIEACELKGFSIGGAQVSPKHANFIINTGTASAADIERLIAHVQARVAREHNVDLIAEVRIVGDAE